MKKTVSDKGRASEQSEAPLKNNNFQFLGISGTPSKFSGLLKLVFGILLLPLVYSVTRSFINELNLLEEKIRVYFSSGIISFLILYLFVWEAEIIYKKGQRFVEVIFRFFSPLVKIAPYVLPIYTIFLFMLYLFVSSLHASRGLISHGTLLIGFSIAFHLVFSARSLNNKQSDYLKGNYIFGFSLIYIINLFLLSFGFNLIFERFSFVNFSNHSFLVAAGIFKALFRQLFL